MKYALCIETIFPNLPFAERLAATRQNGYNAVEIWHTDDGRLPILREEVKDGLEVAMLVASRNLTTRDTAAIEANLELLRRTLDVVRELNCPNICLFVGDRDDDATFSTQRTAVVDFLGQAADILQGSGVTGIVESVNPKHHPTCFLINMAAAAGIITEVDRPEIKLQFDVYHTAMTDDDVEATIERHFDDIAYFQAADAPSRAQPGTGVLNYPRILTRLEERGFDGYFSWEYFPQGDALQSVAAARAVQPQLVF